jgi:putative transposase
MARAWRIEEPGAIYHVGSRGNFGQAVFGDDVDRHEFLCRLERVVRRYRWNCLAYCLMTNHFHLVIRIEDRGLSGGMQELTSGYSRQTNRRYNRSGHIFRQRFFSAHLARQEHLLESCRYVVLNPVRAGLCKSPAHWRWSSYRACAGLSFAPTFLATADLLRLFGSRPKLARAWYREFIAQGRGIGSDAVSDAVSGP